MFHLQWSGPDDEVIVFFNSRRFSQEVLVREAVDRQSLLLLLLLVDQSSILERLCKF